MFCNRYMSCAIQSKSRRRSLVSESHVRFASLELLEKCSEMRLNQHHQWDYVINGEISNQNLK